MKTTMCAMVLAAAGLMMAVPAPMMATATAAAARAGEMIDNPMYQNWSKFKAGTTVKQRTVGDMMGNKTESTTTWKLIEVTAEKVVVEMAASTKMGDQSFDMPAQKMDFPAKVEKPKTEATEQNKVEPKTGEEELTIGGVKYKCKWSEMVTEEGGNKTTVKSWTCDEFPGMTVKSEMKMEGGMAMTNATETIEVTIVK